MKTRIKYLTLAIGLFSSAASFAGLNELGAHVATGAAGIVKWSIDTTRGAYVTAVHPGTKFLGDTMDKTASHIKSW